MNQPPRKRTGQRRPPPRHANAPADIWRATGELPELMPITPIADGDAFLRSLGDPPLNDRSVIAGHYISAVVDRAAAMATALAFSADLVARPDTD